MNPAEMFVFLSAQGFLAIQHYPWAVFLLVHYTLRCIVYCLVNFLRFRWRVPLYPGIVCSMITRTDVIH